MSSGPRPIQLVRWPPQIPSKVAAIHFRQGCYLTSTRGCAVGRRNEFAVARFRSLSEVVIWILFVLFQPANYEETARKRKNLSVKKLEDEKVGFIPISMVDILSSYCPLDGNN